MSFREMVAKRYADSYLKKYGDRLTQVQGHVLSVKITRKSILWIFNKLRVDVLVKPERSKSVTRCYYQKNRWFKKPEFMDLNQGNMVIIQGVKGKKGKENSEMIQILNVKNLTTRKDLVKVDQEVKRNVQRQYIRK